MEPKDLANLLQRCGCLHLASSTGHLVSDAESGVFLSQVMGKEPHLYTVNLAAGSSSQVLTLGAGANWS